MTGLPLKGGLLAGAQLGPDGLLLAKAATLNITLTAAPASGMRPYGFGYSHAGAELHLKGASGSGASVSIEVWHFSGVGVGAGTSADASSMAANHAPTAPADQVAQAQAAGQQVIPLLLGWQAQLDGELGQTSPNLALIDAIYQQLFVFEAMAVAAGRPDLPRSLYAKMALVLKTAAQLALARCRSDPDPLQGLRVIRWLKWANAHPLLLQHLDAASIEGDVVKCLRFRLDFTTTVDATFRPEAVHLAVESKNIAVNAVTALPLKFTPGYGDIKYDTFKWTEPAGLPYRVATATTRQFSVVDVSMNLDVSDSSSPSSVVDGMSLTVDFGDTTETITVTAPIPVVLPLKSFYNSGMENTHHDFMVGPHLFRITPWEVGTHPVWAFAHQTTPCTQGPCAYVMESQDTMFELRHTPQ